MKNLLLFFRGGGCRRAFAHDRENGVFVLGAVPMHLLVEMGDEASGGLVGAAAE